ncbi:hypothetical protein HOD29_05570 [archaeon]|jgi:hypothetical protein|nr:hypothetical protein [archaeon]
MGDGRSHISQDRRINRKLNQIEKTKEDFLLYQTPDLANELIAQYQEYLEMPAGYNHFPSKEKINPKISFLEKYVNKGSSFLTEEEVKLI